MTTIAKNAAALTTWMSQQSIQHPSSTPGGALPAATAQQAATALGLSVADVQQARAHLVEQNALRSTPSTKQTDDVTGRGQQNVAQRGAGAASAAVVARGNVVDPRITAFESSTYSQLDVKHIAKTQQLTPAQAKLFIGEKVARGLEHELQALGVSPTPFDSHELRDVFARSSYTLADAKAAVAAFDFLPTVNDAREYIGLKIVNDYEAMLGDVGITRNTFDSHDCLAAFAKSTYSDADVAAAKKSFDFLKGASTAQVKEYIGLKIVNRYEQMLADVGITPHDFDKQDCLAAFSKSTYSKADVDAARKSFDFLKHDTDAGIREYIGLKIVNGYESTLSEAGITPHRFDDHDCLAAFNKSGYDAQDVAAAKKAFDFLKGSSDVEVKQYIGLKIVNDYESMLKDVGITQR